MPSVAPNSTARIELKTPVRIVDPWFTGAHDAQLAFGIGGAVNTGQELHEEAFTALRYAGASPSPFAFLTAAGGEVEHVRQRLQVRSAVQAGIHAPSRTARLVHFGDEHRNVREHVATHAHPHRSTGGRSADGAAVLTSGGVGDGGVTAVGRAAHLARAASVVRTVRVACVARARPCAASDVAVRAIVPNKSHAAQCRRRWRQDPTLRHAGRHAGWSGPGVAGGVAVVAVVSFGQGARQAVTIAHAGLIASGTSGAAEQGGGRIGAAH